MFLFQINGVLFSFLFIKEPYAYYHGLHKYIKLFLTLIIKKKTLLVTEQQISILENLWRIMWHWRLKKSYFKS